MDLGVIVQGCGGGSGVLAHSAPTERFPTVVQCRGTVNPRSL